MCVVCGRGRSIQGTVTGPSAQHDTSGFAGVLHTFKTITHDLLLLQTHNPPLPKTNTHTQTERHTDMHKLPKRCVQIFYISTAKQCSELLLWPEEMLVYQAKQLLVIISSVQVETLKW